MASRAFITAIAVLLATTGYCATPSAPSAELSRMEARLGTLLQRFTDRHPEVIALREQIRAQREAEGIPQPSVRDDRTDSANSEAPNRPAEEFLRRREDVRRLYEELLRILEELGLRFDGQPRETRESNRTFQVQA